MPKWYKTDLKKVREDIEKMRTLRKAEEEIAGPKWWEYCANCGKPMKDETVWWENVVGHPQEGEGREDFEIEVYCRECIKVDKSRRNKYKIE